MQYRSLIDYSILLLLLLFFILSLGRSIFFFFYFILVDYEVAKQTMKLQTMK